MSGRELIVREYVNSRVFEIDAQKLSREGWIVVGQSQNRRGRIVVTWAFEGQASSDTEGLDVADTSLSHASIWSPGRIAALVVVGIIAILAIIGSHGGKATPTAPPQSTLANTTLIAVQPTQIDAMATATKTPLPIATPLPTVSPDPTSLPTSIPVATPVPQAVTVKEDAVNLRQSPDVAAAVVMLVPPGTDATVIGEDETGPDGVTRYIHARVGDKDGYLRSDLVSGPHAYAPPTVPPPAVAASQAPTAQSASNGTSAAAISAWYDKNGDVFRTLGDDADAISVAAGRYDAPALVRACRRLNVDAQAAMRVPPIPDADASSHLTRSLRYMAAGAQDCAVGWQNYDIPLANQGTAEIQLATGELRLAVAAIRKYM